MPRFLITRTVSPMSEEQLESVGAEVVRAAQRIPNMRWIRSYVTADGQHTFCEFEADSEEDCRRHAEQAGLPVDAVIPIALEIGPARFR
jgi:hypothetical protein